MGKLIGSDNRTSSVFEDLQSSRRDSILSIVKVIYALMVGLVTISQ